MPALLSFLPFGAFAKLRKDAVLLTSCLPGFCVSVRPHRTIWLSLDRFTLNFFQPSIFRKSAENTQVSLKNDNSNGYFTRKPTYIYASMSTNFSQNEKCFKQKVLEKIETHLTSNNSPPPQPRKQYLFETIREKMVQPDRPHMTIRRMRYAWSTTTAINTRSEY